MKKLHISKKSRFINFIKSALTVIISVFVIYGVVQAGNLIPPSGEPIAEFYTLTDIWTRLSTNATAVVGEHPFTFSDSLVGAGKTLTEIYNAIPTIDPTQVRLGTPYLGITGTLVPSGGDALVGDVLIGKTFFGGSQSDWNTKTGTMPNKVGSATIFTPSITDQAITQGYYGGVVGDGKVLGDTDLISSNIKSGINIFGVDGNTNVVDTSSGDATDADILFGKIAFVDGSSVTGTMPNKSGLADFNPTSTDVAILTGFYDGITKILGDADLIASNISSGVNIFGVDGSLSSGYTYGDNNAAYVLGTATAPGTALKNLYNGSASSGDYPQSVGGVDDYNAGGARPADAYTSTWTTCDATSSCGTPIDTTNADKKDNSTGLVWSKYLYGGVTQTWFTANNCLYPNGLPSDDGVCNTTGEVACKCVKLNGTNGAMTGCEALGNGWRLPSQKELMQAYIDGSWNNPANLSNAANPYWSATTPSNNTRNAWLTYLSGGGTSSDLKTNSANYLVRCVR